MKREYFLVFSTINQNVFLFFLLLKGKNLVIFVFNLKRKCAMKTKNFEKNLNCRHSRMSAQKSFLRGFFGASYQDFFRVGANNP